MSNKEENEKIWRERVAKYRVSNQTQRQWCEENNVKLRTLRYWLEKISKEQTVVNLKHKKSHKEYMLPVVFLHIWILCECVGYLTIT